LATLPSRLGRLRSFAPLALLLAAVAGCPGRTNIVQVTQHLQIQPVAGDSYAGYTGTTFGQAIGTGKKIYLRDAQLESSSGEFTWAASMTGSSAPSGTEGAVLLLSRASFAGASGTADLTVNDTDDIHPLYPDGQNFRVYWAWDYATALTQSYPNGITLTFTYTIDLED
jgi:hypothetical protein